MMKNLMPIPPRSEAVIALVDDDLSAREGLAAIQVFQGGDLCIPPEFLARPCAEAPGCVVLAIVFKAVAGPTPN